jgi:hypothetical protein
MMQATHAVYREFVGPIAPGLFVCHTCDTPSCVEVSHLFLGTPRENTQDAVKKRRMKSRAKLTVDHVRAIRADTRRVREVAKEYGVHPSNISAIRTRKSWKDLA